jgi:arsenite-transporting ATPase
VAVFHAFSRVVNEARSAFVVLDTAPTGHSLLLMDATGAYHRQMMQQLRRQANAAHIITPLMRLQDPTTTRVLIVTLPEVTPVSQAAACRTTCAAPTSSRGPGSSTKAWLPPARLTRCCKPAWPASSARSSALPRAGARTYVLPWLPEPPVGPVRNQPYPFHRSRGTTTACAG